MVAMSRLSNLLFVLLGALAVGVVVVALALTGALPDRVERVQTPSETTPIATAPATTPAADGDVTSVADIYAQVSPGVVYVQSSGSGATGSGSGFVIDREGRIVTNEHVVDRGTRFSVRFGKEDDPIPAKLIGKDPSTDLAVLKIDPAKIKGGGKPLTIASSEGLRPGQATIAIGSPFGLSGTVTTGIISALDREIQAPNGFSIAGSVQTDAAINPGNSGGPLLDSKGRVIGVNSQIATGGSNANSGVGFAVPADIVKDVVPKLIADGKIDRAYVGLSSSEDPSRPGALVRTVTLSGPAAEAGVRTGDLVTSIDGKAIRNPSDLGKAVNALKPGRTVKLELRRGNGTEELEVKLGNRPETLSRQG